MARRRSKRHSPKREDFMLKEQIKTPQGIFNTKTMVYLSKFFNKGIISRLGYRIARGKEADIYIAEPGSSEVVAGKEHVILKFFRVDASSFFNMSDYIKGDPRFERQAGRGKAGIINTWCKKEFGNLMLAEAAGVHAPKPYMFNGNILAMEFLGGKDTIFPTLNDAELEKPEKALDELLVAAKRLYKRGLIHADLSEYNILMNDDVPFIIDWGQAVSAKHPRAAEFLRKDIFNLLKFFRRRYGLETDLDATLREITE
ncbi:MAG: serine protein kinase RIO [Candidatus Marsarchaeota archaeon]|jgi:RIO kinase 1|nr:serine protein kinase RIO [Candidatus Marsarchaeota archaeon]MCL5115351.1 serine protein kinase RIO [Candidatus Marsarchaeota archaeon]